MFGACKLQKTTVLAEKELDLIIWFEKTTDLTDKNVTAIFPLDQSY